MAQSLVLKLTDAGRRSDKSSEAKMPLVLPACRKGRFGAKAVNKQVATATRCGELHATACPPLAGRIVHFRAPHGLRRQRARAPRPSNPRDAGSGRIVSRRDC